MGTCIYMLQLAWLSFSEKWLVKGSKEHSERGRAKGVAMHKVSFNISYWMLYSNLCVSRQMRRLHNHLPSSIIVLIIGTIPIGYVYLQSRALLQFQAS